MPQSMIDRFESTLGGIKPAFATVLTGANIFANVSVWAGAIKDWAAVATVLIGLPTAFLILIYWSIKVRREWKNRNRRES